MEVVHVIRPADPRSVVALCVIGAIAMIIALFKGYLDMVGQAGSILVLVLNAIFIPYLLIRIAMHGYRHHWLRALLCLALIPAIGFFTYSEAQMMPHAKRYFFASHTNDTELGSIKYTAPASWQLELLGSVERVKVFARAGGTFGLTFASFDAKLYRYMGLAAFQQRCVSVSPITQEDKSTLPALQRLFGRARLVYAAPDQAKTVCGSEEAIAQNYGLSLKEMLAAELADNRAALAKIEALGSRFSSICNNNSIDTACSVIGLGLLNTTTDAGSVRGCSVRERREDCVRVPLPNPHAPNDRAAWGTSPLSQQSYDNWRKGLALLRNPQAEGCYGQLCRALYNYMH